MNIWILILIMMGYKVIIKALVKMENNTHKFISLIIMLCINILLISPITFNTIFEYIGLNIVLTWRQALPLGVIIGSYAYNDNN